MNLIRLFSPIKINRLQLKNRVIMPAIHHLYNPGGYATDRFNQYYWKKAEGGVGLIVVGACRIDDYGGMKDSMSLQSDEFIPGYQEFTAGIHERGAKVAVQLMHMGRYAKTKDNPSVTAALAPSAVYSSYTKETPREMTIAEIKTITRQWSEAAVRAQKAGFDAVEIASSAGYLLSEFLSPFTNLRTDEYGGSWENRCRFPLEVVRSVREAVGDDYPIIVRIAGNDFMQDGNTNAEAVMFAQLLEKAGVDLISVTGGWHETVIPQLPGDVPRGGYAYLAAAVKDAVSIPVVACNRINDPLVAEEILALGKADLVGLGRPLIADPDWCIKAQEGRFEEIRRCVACNQGCLSRTFFDRPVECLVNCHAGKEYLLTQNKTEHPKKFLVIGAGPSGCEFAIGAAALGHTVTLWEKENCIGGQLPLVAAPPAKHEFSTLKKYYEVTLKKSGVDVVLGKEATLTDLLSGDFDEIVFATGVVTNRISLPGENRIPVYTAAEVLEGKVVAGKDVVVVGGGSVGCETAQYLAHKGSLSPEQLHFMLSQGSEPVEKVLKMLHTSRRNISIVDIAKIGSGFELGTGWPVMKDLRRLGVKQHPLSRILNVTDCQVIIEKTDRKDNSVSTLEIACDTIILAVGSKPNNALYQEAKHKLSNIHLIGDANKIGNIMGALKDADALVQKLCYAYE